MIIVYSIWGYLITKSSKIHLLLPRNFFLERQKWWENSEKGSGKSGRLRPDLWLRPKINEREILEFREGRNLRGRGYTEQDGIFISQGFIYRSSVLDLSEYWMCLLLQSGTSVSRRVLDEDAEIQTKTSFRFEFRHPDANFTQYYYFNISNYHKLASVSCWYHCNVYFRLY